MPHKDLEKRKTYYKNYNKKHKEHKDEYNKNYRITHKKQISENKKKYYKANLEKQRNKNKKYYKANKEECIRNQKRYNEMHKDRKKEYDKEYRKTHKKERNLHNNRRRIRKINTGGLHTIGEWENLKAQYNWTCPACHKKEPFIKLTRDHIIPLVKGGSDNIENIQPLCRSCNTSKYTKIKKYDYCRL